MANKNTFELIVSIEKDPEKFTPIYNTVLFEYKPEENYVTPGGILVPQQDMRFAKNAIRISTVVKTPMALYYYHPLPSDDQKEMMRKTQGSMLWKTDIEVQPGDVAITNHLDSNSAWKYTWNGKYYRSLDYSAIEAIKRDGQIIPVNGNILLKRIKYTETILGYSKDKEYADKFVVAYVGKRNQEYNKPDYIVGGKIIYRRDFEEEIKPGDKVLISKKYVPMLRDLEAYDHAKFDNRNMYVVCKRYMIEAFIRE